MSLVNKLLSASGGVDKLFSDDVFQSFTRTGTGADVVVPTGIDMTKGYMLWSKGRSAATDHAIYDSARGLTFDLASNTTAAQTTQSTGLKAVSATGHTVGSLAKMNTSGATYVDFVFRKAPKFFDVVTYTGTGINRTVPHSLNSEVGTLIVKRTDTAADWQVYHRSAANTEYLVLNSTAAKATGTTRWNSTIPSTTAFSLGTDITVNANGGTYVAYLYAHDTTADSIVQCGSFTTSQSVSLGWEPQYILYKRYDSGAVSGNDNWFIKDTARDWKGGSAANGQDLQANKASAESNSFAPSITSTGFIADGSAGSFIYLAIRRSNKPPTVGTEVYNAIARTGTGAAATVTGVGFAPDLVIDQLRSSGGNRYGGEFTDRLRGNTNMLFSALTDPESTFTDTITSFDMNGMSVGVNTNALGVNSNGITIINYFLKRSVGVFDEVCYTGSNSAITVQHGLGVVPELMIIKGRTSGTDWPVYHSALGAAKFAYLNLNNASVTSSIIWNNSPPTANVFTLGITGIANGSNTDKYVAYLFASKAGISSCFSYTGNGSSQTIDCGFTTGARFIMVKSSSATGNWNVGDSTRGITSGTDPLLYLNSTAAEITVDDWLDPASAGFIVNETTNAHANVNGVTYIGLAFA